MALFTGIIALWLMETICEVCPAIEGGEGHEIGTHMNSTDVHVPAAFSNSRVSRNGRPMTPE